MEKKMKINVGDISFEETGNGDSIIIPKLYAYLPDETEITKEYIIEKLKEERVHFGIDEEVIDYYLKKAQYSETPISNVIVAQAKIPFRKGADKYHFLVDSQLDVYDFTKWKIVNDFLSDSEFEPDTDLPFDLIFVHEGQAIAEIEKVVDRIPGKNIFDEEIHASRAFQLEFKAGENVYFDENKNKYVAGVCGYLSLSESAFVVKEAFRIDSDNMTARFINLPRTNAKDYPRDVELYNFFQRSKILDLCKKKVDLSSFGIWEHPIIAQGKLPGESRDADVKIHFDMHQSIGYSDDHDNIDYKIRNKFKNVKADVLLAEKVLPVKGEPGTDLLGKQINARAPKDVVLRYSKGTRIEKTETEIKVYCAEDGILDYHNSTISVFPTITLRGDVDLESGHINTTANVEIMGNVLAGFNVKSEKNIFIKGNIEDNCIIESGGDITLQGGVNGESTKIICGGAFTAKYVETCTLVAKGQITVQRFIRGAKVRSYDNILVFGSSINLNERGAIVDSEIYVKKELHCPVVGSPAGLPTVVHFGNDNQLCDKIKNLEETCAKIEENIKEVLAQFELDLNSPTIYNEMQELTSIEKEKVIQAIQQKNKLEKKLTMMSKILKIETEKREDMIKKSFVSISMKVLPDLILHCHNLQKTVDKIDPPSKYYYDYTTKFIERSSFT